LRRELFFDKKKGWYERVSLNIPRPLPSTPFLTYYLPDLMTPNTIYSELLVAPLNKA
jgi:hypothetical protein